MGKTLLKLAVGLLATTVVTASFLIGSNMDKIKGNPQNAQNTSYVSDNDSKKPERKEIKKSLESYFIQDKEIGNIKLYSADTPNPVISDIKNLGEEDRTEYKANKIVRLGLAEYVLPGTENSSEKNLSLKILEFESNQAIKEFLEKNKEDIPYPILVKDNILSLIEKVTPKESNSGDSFDEEQQTRYLNTISNYAAKKGMEMISSKYEIEKVIYKTGENNAESKIASNSNSTSTNEPANVIISGRLEDYLLQGNELKYIKLSSTGEPNPVTEGIKDLKDGDEKKYFESNKILRAGLGEYRIPSVESYSREKDLTLNILEFASKKDEENFISKNLVDIYPIFTKGNIMSLFEGATINDIDSDDFSEAQKMICISLIFDYSKRTGTKFKLDQDDAKSQDILNAITEFKDKYYLKNHVQF